MNFSGVSGLVKTKLNKKISRRDFDLNNLLKNGGRRNKGSRIVRMLILLK